MAEGICISFHIGLIVPRSHCKARKVQHNHLSITPSTRFTSAVSGIIVTVLSFKFHEQAQSSDDERQYTACTNFPSFYGVGSRPNREQDSKECK